MDISLNKTIILTQAQVLGICYDKICSDLKWFINTANEFPMDDNGMSFYSHKTNIPRLSDIVNVRIEELGYDAPVHISTDEFFEEETNELEACHFLIKSLGWDKDLNDYLNDIYDFLVKNKKIIPKSIIPDEPYCLKDVLIEYLLGLNPDIDYEELEEEGMERK